MESASLNLDGERVDCPATYPMFRTLEAGDLVDVHGHTFEWRDGDAALKLVSETAYGACTSLFELRDGERVPLAVVVAEAGAGVTTLADLTRQQRAELRSVSIRQWTPEAQEHLGETNPAHCVYRVDGGFDPTPRVLEREPTVRCLPELPRGCRHLLIQHVSFCGGDTYTWDLLGELEQLETLSAPLGFSDLGLLSRCQSLRALSLTYNRLEELGALAELAQLQFLDLTHNELYDLSPLAALERLEVLLIPLCEGEFSLEPLASLPRLRRLDANVSGATQLPTAGWPALEHLEVMSTRLSESDSQRFRTEHPSCVVHAEWERRFAAAVRGADRLRVRTGGTCHREPESERTLAEFGPGEVAKFVERFRIFPGRAESEIDESARRRFERHDRDGDGLLNGEEVAAISDPQVRRALRRLGLPVDLAAFRGVTARSMNRFFRCRCCGGPTFELYAGDRLLAMIGFHHAKTVRWEGWPTDASLAPGAAEYLGSLIPSSYPLK